ncbi:MAG TPA: sensor histidine kinase, partial [Bacteroidales bacterium]|nr:sensor histidine kinase [Bacteroidales bacterium]
HELIENVTGNFLIQIENSGGLLIPSLHAEKFMVKADPVHLTNVISNLIDNAIKYTPENPEIFIETRNIDDYVQVSVKDNGIGISRNNQKRVFERFYRVPTGNVHNVKGFGLGLNYVKKIIEIHKGSIEVESEPGNGTTFSFRLPLKTQNSYARN